MNWEYCLGGRTFVKKMKELLDIRAKGRDVLEGARGISFERWLLPIRLF
jgi:hypothetical protein